jgi:hypothetical protein
LLLECSRGQYGFNCKKTCSNCKDQTCSPVTGVCNDGCIAGWKSDKCNQGIKFCTQYINVLFSMHEIPQTYILGINRLQTNKRTTLALKIYLPENKDTH